MTGQLITLPVRMGLRGAMLMARVVEGVSDRALGMTLRVTGAVLGVRPRRPFDPRPPRAPDTPAPVPAASSVQTKPRSERAGVAAGPNGSGELASQRLEREGRAVTLPRSEPAPATPPEPAPATPPEPAATAPGPAPVAPPEPTAVTPREPAHISEEPELVLESAAPAAAEGAGASVTVREPWEGYEGMNARTVISRLATATAAELAAVELYEHAHRARRTVMEAAERELRTKSRGR